MKNHGLRQKIIFFPILVGGGGAGSLDPPLNSGTETKAYTTHCYINIFLQSIHTNIFLRVWIVKGHSPMLTIHNTNQSDRLPQITKHANKTDNKIDKIVLVCHDLKVTQFKNTRIWVRIMMFNATFNNVSSMSWRSVLLVEETRVPGENHRPAASH